jgi:hypothetical protein
MDVMVSVMKTICQTVNYYSVYRASATINKQYKLEIFRLTVRLLLMRASVRKQPCRVTIAVYDSMVISGFSQSLR